MTSESVSMSNVKQSLVHVIQTVEVTGDPFKLAFRGHETASIAVGESQEDIATKLADLFSISAGGVEVTANADDITDWDGVGVSIGSVFDVKFTKELGPLPAMDATDAVVNVLQSGIVPVEVLCPWGAIVCYCGDIALTGMISLVSAKPRNARAFPRGALSTECPSAYCLPYRSACVH